MRRLPGVQRIEIFLPSDGSCQHLLLVEVLPSLSSITEMQSLPHENSESLTKWSLFWLGAKDMEETVTSEEIVHNLCVSGVFPDIASLQISLPIQKLGALVSLTLPRREKKSFYRRSIHRRSMSAEWHVDRCLAHLSMCELSTVHKRNSAQA
jgi:hypothetical protein